MKKLQLQARHHEEQIQRLQASHLNELEQKSIELTELRGALQAAQEEHRFRLTELQDALQEAQAENAKLKQTNQRAVAEVIQTSSSLVDNPPVPLLTSSSQRSAQRPG